MGLINGVKAVVGGHIDCQYSNTEWTWYASHITIQGITVITDSHYYTEYNSHITDTYITIQSITVITDSHITIQSITVITDSHITIQGITVISLTVTLLYRI